jgi:isopentenyl phosphate kinase
MAARSSSEARREPDHRQGASRLRAARGDPEAGARARGRGEASSRPAAARGHGSGSFGHVAAARSGLIPGADAKPSPDAIARTQRAAAELHRIVVAALHGAGARPFSFAPSSFLHAAGGRLAGPFAGPIFEALDHGLLPVVYGDVVLDARRGAVIVSTEELFQVLAKEAVRRKLEVAAWSGLARPTAFATGSGRTIRVLRRPKPNGRARRVTGASGIDVTGGMALRLRAAGALAETGVSSAIVDDGGSARSGGDRGACNGWNPGDPR